MLEKSHSEPVTRVSERDEVLRIELTLEQVVSQPCRGLEFTLDDTLCVPSKVPSFNHYLLLTAVNACLRNRIRNQPHYLGQVKVHDTDLTIRNGFAQFSPDLNTLNASFLDVWRQEGCLSL